MIGVHESLRALMATADDRKLRWLLPAFRPMVVEPAKWEGAGGGAQCPFDRRSLCRREAFWFTQEAALAPSHVLCM